MEKLDAKNPALFAADFNLIDPANLPKPAMDRLYNNSIFQKEWDSSDEGIIKSDDKAHGAHKSKPDDSIEDVDREERDCIEDNGELRFSEAIKVHQKYLKRLSETHDSPAKRMMPHDSSIE